MFGFSSAPVSVCFRGDDKWVVSLCPGHFQVTPNQGFFPTRLRTRKDPNLLIPCGPALAVDENAAPLGAKEKLQEAVAW